MSYAIIALTALVASFLTFFSGFGLGTILMPVFAVFFDLPTAIALTAIVHLLNNLFKLSLVGKNIQWAIVLKFGLPALLASFAGAWVLKAMDASALQVFSYEMFSRTIHVTWSGLIIGAVIFLFAIIELNEQLSSLTFDAKWMYVGGLLTGFFGGLSGHQGALRSAFLLRLNLDKKVFIASGVAIACMVDLARLSIYSFTLKDLQNNYAILLLAVGAAFAGAIIGNKVFTKTSIAFLKWMVGGFMMVVSLLIMFGLITK